MVNARAENVVRFEALRETDCADLEVSQEGAGYTAKGCGKVIRYTCDRPVGMGLTKPAAVANAGCRKQIASAAEPTK